MKMTKIESARIIVGQKGDCRGINCNHCFCHDKCFKDRWQDLDEEEGEDIAVKYAKAYIKRHESKSKKKDHITDASKKVEEPKPIKTVGIDNSDVTLAQHEPIPLQIAKMIRDNNYECAGIAVCGTCEFKCWNNAVLVRRQLIDDYISANEPVKDCPANSEYPQPKTKCHFYDYDNDRCKFETYCIDRTHDGKCSRRLSHSAKTKSTVDPQPIKFEDEVPEYVYIVYASVIRCYVVIGGFKKVIDKNLDGSIRETFTIYAVPMTEERGEWLDAKGCYRTLEEAVIVAKKLWGSK